MPIEPAQTAMTLITTAAHTENTADLAELLDATFGQDLREQGDPLAQIDYLVKVAAKLVLVSAMFARVFAEQHGEPLERTLQRLAVSELLADGT